MHSTQPTQALETAPVRSALKRVLLSSLFATGLWICLASAALAGPTTTTTEPTTTTTSPTTTTTSPTTTTTSPTTTTTAATTTTTSSTTTTQPPVNLSGQYAFADEKTFDANSSFLNIDTGLNQMCVAGAVEEPDRLQLPFNEIVTFYYDANSAIDKATDKKVKGVFGEVTVQLRLLLMALNASESDFDQTIFPTCKVQATLDKAGDHAKVTLRCDLGENLSSFTGLTPGQLTNIDNAFGKGKRAKVNVKSGKLKIVHSGQPTEAEPPNTCQVLD